MKWQPIETAPNDGSQFIVWNGEEMAILNQPPSCSLGRWHKIQGKWVGSYVSFNGASHWMQIPIKPKTKG